MNKFGLVAVVVFSCIFYSDSIQRHFELTFNFEKREKFAAVKSGL